MWDLAASMLQPVVRYVLPEAEALMKEGLDARASSKAASARATFSCMAFNKARSWAPSLLSSTLGGLGGVRLTSLHKWSSPARGHVLLGFHQRTRRLGVEVCQVLPGCTS